MEGNSIGLIARYQVGKGLRKKSESEKCYDEAERKRVLALFGLGDGNE